MKPHLIYKIQIMASLEMKSEKVIVAKKVGRIEALGC
jgi:hypothetical protein